MTTVTLFHLERFYKRGSGVELATVEGLRAGDARAFHAVYDAYAARLFTFLARLSRRRDLAEDLAEETWLRLVANAPRLRSDTRLGPWLFAVARNLYASACRSAFGGRGLLGRTDWIVAVRRGTAVAV